MQMDGMVMIVFRGDDWSGETVFGLGLPVWGGYVCMGWYSRSVKLAGKVVWNCVAIFLAMTHGRHGIEITSYDS